MNSTELFNALYSGVKFTKVELSEFEKLVLVILIKQSSFKNSYESLLNLKAYLSLESLANLESEVLANFIKPSGNAKKKSVTLLNLCKNILDEFGDFEFFKSSASKEWLLQNKGVSIVSVDEIMSFVCGAEEMAVSTQALKITKFLNYEFESYFEAKEWFENIELDKLEYEFKSLNEFFCLYQALIYEFSNLHIKGSNLSQKGKEILSF
ncbi:MAG: endonuclease III [Campylobacteraceae bacterium]|nr:endonuclease III [Campylobacteraceae bacterium]